MATIIDNQHISKRSPKRRSSENFFTPFNDSYYKSAYYDTGISQFRQKPVRSRNRKSSTVKFPSLRDTFFRFHNKTRREKQYTPKNTNRSLFTDKQKTVSGQSRSSGFSFSIPSLPALAVIAGTVVFSLIVLNWDGINIKTPSEYAFQSIIASDSENHTLKYAATGISLPGMESLNNQNDDIDEEKMGAIPPELIEGFKWTSYKVKRGDSVSVIAQRFGVSRDAIIASNNIKNVRQLQEGANLRIPNIDGIPYQIKKGDSLSQISAVFKVPLEVILDVNDIRSDILREGETLFIPGARMNNLDLKLALGELFIYPVPKNISSPFGWRHDPFTGARSFHTGLDLRGRTGDTVKAAMDGTVSFLGNSRVYGKHIILTHDNGYKTLYAHLSAFSARHGEKVSQGRKIGEIGNTGMSTGPHLHFGIFRNGTWVNPLDLLN